LRSAEEANQGATVKIRALIVDDEPLARQRLRALLAGEPDIEVIGECADGSEAVAAIREHEPDLLFLDVQMPKLDGFGVLETVGPEQMPATIFVTAYDRYALQAFEVHALDYLLKPFDRKRFQKALRRARLQFQSGGRPEGEARLQALAEGTKTGRKPQERLVIKAGGRVFFLKTDEIDWIEAAGNYARVHAGGESHLLRETMGGLEARLDPDKFLRIHRSTIVNIERIQELQPWFHGDYVVILRDGTQLTLSRSYRQKLQEFFGNSL
jgi:two-component system LytT family response regulator